MKKNFILVGLLAQKAWRMFFEAPNEEIEKEDFRHYKGLNKRGTHDFAPIVHPPPGMLQTISSPANYIQEVASRKSGRLELSISAILCT